MTLRPLLYVLAGLAASVVALAVILLAARCGTRADRNGDQP